MLQELICFGVSISNANISELRDLPGDDNKYFESLKRQVSLLKLACMHVLCILLSLGAPQGQTLNCAVCPVQEGNLCSHQQCQVRTQALLACFPCTHAKSSLHARLASL